MLDVAVWIVAIKAYWAELNSPIATLLLVIIGLLYWSLRRTRDFYIVRRIGYVRNYVESRNTYGRVLVHAGRGKIVYESNDAYEDFGAARAAFDYLQTLFPGDMSQEWEMSIYVVRAFTPSQAIRCGKAMKYPDRTLTNSPYSQILANRKIWEEERKAQLENDPADAERLQS
jgi:hypothetical protein